jgi:hypothetical protein
LPASARGGFDGTNNNITSGSFHSITFNSSTDWSVTGNLISLGVAYSNTTAANAFTFAPAVTLLGNATFFDGSSTTPGSTFFPLNQPVNIATGATMSLNASQFCAARWLLRQAVRG